MANAQLLRQVSLPEHTKCLKCDAVQSTDLVLIQDQRHNLCYSVRLDLRDIRTPVRSTSPSPYKCRITSLTDPVPNPAISVPTTWASTLIPLTLSSLHTLHHS